MKPLAVLCSDLHLSHNPPSARKTDDWYGVMAERLGQLKVLVEDLNVPLVVAGDIFDRYYGAIGKNATRLVSFAMEHLPDCYAIPGQHDLPYHNYADMADSAYHLLIQEGTIRNLYPHVSRRPDADSPLVLHGFPWNEPLTGINPSPDTIEVAVVHHYAWTQEGDSYPGAPETSHIAALRQQLTGYDAVVFGDNHQGWQRQTWINTGSFICRHRDEIDYRPFCGILYQDTKGKVKIRQHFWDISADEWTEDSIMRTRDEIEAASPELFGDLDTIADELDFRSAVYELIERDNVGESVAQILKEAVNDE